MNQGIEVVTDEAGLAALWQPWLALWQRVPNALPFLAPGWLRPWWSVFGTGLPVVAVLRGPDGLDGVLPLYRLGDKLLPMGVGISDYFDVLLTPGAAADGLLAAALGAGGGIRCDLPELPEQAVLRTTAAPSAWSSALWPGPPCPVLRLAPELVIPKGMRRDLRQARNRAGRALGWTVERADAAGYSTMFAVLARLHGARWSGRGESGVLDDPRVLQFHEAAGPGLLAAGLLRLGVLRLGDKAAAAVYALVADERIFFYLSGFDPEDGFESPGTILLGHMIEEAASEGRREAHFLRGGEAYKYAWGGVDRFNAGRSFTPS